MDLLDMDSPVRQTGAKQSTPPKPMHMQPVSLGAVQKKEESQEEVILVSPEKPTAAAQNQHAPKPPVQQQPAAATAATPLQRSLVAHQEQSAATPAVGAQQPQVFLKIMEKMLLPQKDSTINNVRMYGQITLGGNFAPHAVAQLELLGPHWTGSNALNRRITPNQFPVVQVDERRYHVKVDAGAYPEPRGVIDYIIPAATFFTPAIVPLLFVYKQETQAQGVCVFHF